MQILSNVPALRVNTLVGRSNRVAETSMQRLSSGIRINTAGDDAAGLSIANRFRREINGLDRANQNALDGVSIVQTADGALNEVHAILQRIREITVQGATDSVTDDDRQAFQREIDQLLDEMENIGRNTQFNGRALFSGTFEQAEGHRGTGAITHGRIGVRINTRQDDILNMNFQRLSIFDLGTSSGIEDGRSNSNFWAPGFSHGSVAHPIPDQSFITGGAPAAPYTLFPPHFSLASALHSAHGGGVLTDNRERDASGLPIGDQNPSGYDSGLWMSRALDLLDGAINEISSMRSSLGAYENRLQQTSSTLVATGINMQQSLSRIIDTDMALEMSRLTQQNVISQAGISVLSMANQRPQQILQLLNF